MCLDSGNIPPSHLLNGRLEIRQLSAEPSGAHARTGGVPIVLLFRDARHCCTRGCNTVLVFITVVLWESLIVEIVRL
jgi:hypothetical protein